MDNTEYILTLSENGNNALTSLAYRLKIDKAEVFARAIMLLELAIDADEVLLITDGNENKVKVK